MPHFRLDPQFLMILGGGAAAVGLVLVLYFLWLRRRERRKAERLGAELTGGMRRPKELAAPEELARISELTSKFEEGVQTFKNAGKNLYSLPWYVLVGEPGSGKTEALRHCGVPTPGGLGELPGVGGTINMNWWFTNHGVVLDTAGRIMFQSVGAGKTSEWKRFLELLNKARPACPINGLLLVIPADSLILDTNDKIQEKATRVAKQLDLIQRTLGIRFPVFVVITKSDLINGFRSFFDTLRDPQLANQILGWSNPETDLDAPFDPEQVDRHLEDVRQRLLSRRMSLLLEPVNTEDPGARRADQVDDLYSFPDSLVAIAPRLRRYMETIFVQGEWSPKPLFVRGIYFTSSMRQGSALDKELADALGLPVNSLPEGRVWDQDRAFFLRDLFMKKVFPEKGLVTREKKATGLHRRRKVAVLAAGFGAVAVLLGLTFFGSQQLEKSILSHRDWWARLKARSEANAGNWDLVQPVLDGAGAGGGGGAGAQYTYAGGTQPFKDTPQFKGDATTLSELHDNALAEVQAPIEVPAVFRPMASFQGNLAEKERREAYRAVFQKTVLVPVVEAVRNRLTAPSSPAWDDDATAALAQLIRLEMASAVPAGGAAGATGRDGAAPAAAHPRLQLAPLFRYALGGESTEAFTDYKKDEAALQNNLDSLYGPGARADEEPGGAWPPPLLRSTPHSREVLAAAVKRFRDTWARNLPADLSNRPGPLTDLRLGLLALESAENETAKALLQAVPNGPKDRAQYASLFKAWRDGLGKMASGPKEKEIDTLVQKVRAKFGPAAGRASEKLLDLYKQDLKVDLDRGRRGYQALLEEIPDLAPTAATTLPASPMAPAAPAFTVTDEQRAATETLSDARQKLQKGLFDLPKLDAAVGDKVAEEFDRLQDNYLTPGKGTDGGDQPKYKSYMQAYRLADERLGEPTTGPRPAGPQAAVYLPTPGESLADQLTRLKPRLNAITTAADATLAKGVDLVAPRDGHHGDQVHDLCHYVVERMGVPFWRYYALTAVLDGDQAPKNKDAVAAAVAGWVKASNSPVDEQPVLPFAAFKKGEAYKPEYHNTEAAKLYGIWSELAPQLPPAAAAPAAPTAVASADGAAPVPAAPPAAPATPVAGPADVLEAAAVRKSYDTRTAAAFHPYVADYVQYWAGLLDKARPARAGSAPGQPGVQVGDWKAFKAGLPADAAPVNAGLTALVAEAATAFDRMGPIAPPTVSAQVIKLQQDLRAAKAMLANPRFQEACGTAVRSWRDLDADPAKAAAYLFFQVKVVAFAQKYLIPPDDKAGDVAADYWSAVTYQGFDSLFKANAEANKGRQPDPVASARAKYDRFPLAAPARTAGAAAGAPAAGPPAVSTDLTAKEVDQARAELAVVKDQIASLTDEPLTDAEKKLDRALWDKFRRLGPQKPGEAELQWMARAEKMLKALPAAGVPKSCIIRTLVLADQKAEQQKQPFANIPLGVDLLNVVRVGNQALFQDTYPQNAAGAVKLTARDISDNPNLGIDFQFRAAAAAPPLSAPVEKGPWAPIRALYSGRAVPADPPGTAPANLGKIWHLEVVQPNFPLAGQQRSAWFALQFDDPIPVAPGTP